MHESVSQMGGKRKEEEGGRRSQGFDLPLCPQMKIGTTIKVIPIIHVEPFTKVSNTVNPEFAIILSLFPSGNDQPTIWLLRPHHWRA